MKPAAVILCLLVTVGPVSAGQPAGKAAPQLREVRFEGDPAFQPEALEKVLTALRSRRVIPGIWTRRPRYDARAVEADVARLGSFHVSQGYFDARVGIGGVTEDGDHAILTLEVRSGPRFPVRRLGIDGVPGQSRDIRPGPDGEFPADPLCACLLEARRTAESHGRIDFAVQLEVSETDGPPTPETAGAWVDVTARVRPGPSYAVGRITFSGHRRISESTLRRAMTLPERSVFDVDKLRASLARLNRLGLFEPLALHDVEIERHPGTRTADLTIALRERRARSWSLSGPVGPSALGLLEATLSSRLPPWGRGIFEASTYSLTVSLTGFSNPLIRLLRIPIRPGPPARLMLQRPYLPGQALVSGFALSPQLSVPQLVTGYGVTHLDRATQAALIGDPADSSALLIPISRRRPSAANTGSGEARFLICTPPAPSYQRLRRGAALAATLTLGALRPF